MKINTTKRLLCALVAVLIAMTVLPGISVFADGTASITLNAPTKDGKQVDITGMVVKAYQVLVASESETDSSKLVNFREHAAFSAFFDAARTGLADTRAGKDGATEGEFFYLTLGADKKLVYSTSAPTGKTKNVDYLEVKSKAVELDYASAGVQYKTFGASLLSVILSGNADSSTGQAGTQVPATNASAAKLIAEWLEAYAETNPSGMEVAGPETAGKNSVTLSNLDEGYWLVVTERAPENVANVRTVLRTTRGKTETIDMKLEEQSVKKEVKRHAGDKSTDGDYDVSASGGAHELFDYKITAAIQDMTDYKDSEANYIYRITDTMENQQLVTQKSGNAAVSGTTLNKNAFTVTFKAKDGTTLVTYIDDPNAEAPTRNLNTILNAAKSTYGTYGEIEIDDDDTIIGQQFVLDFNVHALHALWEELELGKAGKKPADGVTIEITYTAELTSDALHKNGNDVEKKYHNNPNLNEFTEETTEEDEKHTDVWSFGFDLEKDFTAEDGVPTNVTFRLYGPYKATEVPESVTGKTAIEFVEGISKGAAEPDVADPEEEEEEEEVPSPMAVTKNPLVGGKYDKADSADTQVGDILTVDGNGHLRVTGLAPGYYVLEEVTSDSAHNYIPAGLVKLYIGEDEDHVLLYDEHNNNSKHDPEKTSFAELIKKVFGNDNTCIDTGVLNGNDETNWLLKLKLLNYKDNEYPETGGMGVLMLGVLGVLMIAAAAYIFVSQKKRNEA
ncbi:MAG: LPXTG cell wall anchor domain-containing protein [Oscillospiraceae bacterium]|nr:LPXTG cell wall anchor domain-containing protein [Oscillospiraceae bacterium]